MLSQLLLKNPNEPPVVFHWFPVIGNTVTYGMDPYGFFFACRKKVCLFPFLERPTRRGLRVIKKRLIVVSL